MPNRRDFVQAGAAAIVGGTLLRPVRADGAVDLLHPAYLDAADIATERLPFLWHRIKPLLAGDLAGWSLLEGMGERFGTWFSQIVTADRIAATVNSAMPTAGQPPLRRIEELVFECAAVLRLKKPQVFVRSDPTPRCYVVGIGDGHVLVLTSGMANLFEDAPDELRFVVGSELGYSKTGYHHLRRTAYGLLDTLRELPLPHVPTGLQATLATLAFGRFCSWLRETHFSADRAGLLCCQDVQTAYNALARLLSGLPAGSRWIDPGSDDFDAGRLLAEHRRWEDEPFVRFVKQIQQDPADCPFVHERVAALKTWADRGSWRGLLGRTAADARAARRRLVVLDAIAVDGLAGPGETVDPYVVLSTRRGTLLTTKALAGRSGAVSWTGIAEATDLVPGEPLFGEVWDDDYGYDRLIAGFVARPDALAAGRSQLCHCNLVWDWNERSAVTRPGRAQVRFRFEERL